MAGAARAVSVAVLVMAVAVLVGGVLAQSMSECTQSLTRMSPCFNYLMGNEATPSSSCCSQLAALTMSQPKCACVVLEGDSTVFGLDVNKTRAHGLADACIVQAPPFCNLDAAPTTSTSAGTVSKSMPMTDDGTPQGSTGLVVDPKVYAVAAL